MRLSDRIAYINHDIDDAIRANIISQESLPRSCIKVLGETHGQRINNMVEDVISSSLNKAYIRMSDKVEKAINELRDFMFEKVYVGTISKNQENEADNVIKGLFYYFSNNPLNATTGIL